MDDRTSAETTILLQAERDPGFTFLYMAATELTDTGRGVLDEPSELFNQMGAENPKPVLVSELPRTILELLLTAAHGEETTVPDVPAWLMDEKLSDWGRSLYAFAEYLTFARLVPFEFSPAENHSLGEIAMQSAARIVTVAKGVVHVVQAKPVLVKVLGPAAAVLAPVIAKVAIGAGGAVVVIDTYGVVSGVAQAKPVQETARKTRERIHQAYDWLRRRGRKA